jgi:DNA-binding GntR family transcriptional regulator
MASGVQRLATAVGANGQRTLADRAFVALHDAILTGELEPGERLPIEALGGVLGMSAMPIREALRRLDAAGLVENVPHRGARVTELSLGDLAEIYEARLALEPLAVTRAAEEFTPRDAQAATERLLQLERRPDDDSAETWATHKAFHFSLYEAAGSSWLLRLIQPLWEMSHRYLLSVKVASKLDSRRDEHGLILQACIEHDPPRAALLLHDHLVRTANDVSLAMGGQQLFELRGAF